MDKCVIKVCWKKISESQKPCQQLLSQCFAVGSPLGEGGWTLADLSKESEKMPLRVANCNWVAIYCQQLIAFYNGDVLSQSSVLKLLEIVENCNSWEFAVALWLLCLILDQVVWIWTLARGLVFLARDFTLTVPLSTQVYKWVPINLMQGIALWWASIPSREE